MNDLGTEGLILARLAAQITVSANPASGEAKRICSLATILGAADLGPQLPALVVEPNKVDVEEQFAHGNAAKVREHWLVVVAWAATPDVVNFSATFADAGALMANVRQALQGWQPGAAYDLMEFEGMLEPTGKAGEVDFGLQFSVISSREAA